MQEGGETKTMSDGVMERVEGRMMNYGMGTRRMMDCGMVRRKDDRVRRKYAWLWKE